MKDTERLSSLISESLSDVRFFNAAQHDDYNRKLKHDITERLVEALALVGAMTEAEPDGKGDPPEWEYSKAWRQEVGEPDPPDGEGV